MEHCQLIVQPTSALCIQGPMSGVSSLQAAIPHPRSKKVKLHKPVETEFRVHVWVGRKSPALDCGNDGTDPDVGPGWHEGAGWDEQLIQAFVSKFHSLKTGWVSNVGWRNGVVLYSVMSSSGFSEPQPCPIQHHWQICWNNRQRRDPWFTQVDFCQDQHAANL